MEGLEPELDVIWGFTAQGPSHPSKRGRCLVSDEALRFVHRLGPLLFKHMLSPPSTNTFSPEGSTDGAREAAVHFSFPDTVRDPDHI